MTNIHAELKILKAELIRLNFEEYLNSEFFRLLMLENDIDDIFKQALNETNRFDKERRITSFTLILNQLMYHWINSKPESEISKRNYSNFVFLLKIIIKGYFESQKKPGDAIKILSCLDKITMLQKTDIAKIGKDLKEVISQKKQQMIISEEKTNKMVEINLKSEVQEIEIIDYAIITALEDDEMEKVLPFINKIYEIDGSKNLIEVGSFKDNPEKKIVYASQHNPGMVDASILASEMIIKFKPTYLIMVGVLGGKPDDTAIGDVVVATKVFEIERGKITEAGFKKETSVANITSKVVKKISRSKKQIESFLNESDETRNSEIKLHFGPIACVNQVIDIPDFFSDKISSVERKAIALEMESFAIVRACELLNNGITTPIIIKSVMDNTQGKTDDAKPYAAWTSAKTLHYILANNII